MSKTLSEYFKPGKAMILVAMLLLGSMGLQIYLLPSVLGLNTDGVIVEGTVVGVVLIFSYTLTALGFLFLLMEYFNMKNRVKTYLKLTAQQGLPSELLEDKKRAVEPELFAELPKPEKPVKRGLFGFGGGKRKEQVKKPLKEPKPKKPGILSLFAKKHKADEPKSKEENPKTKFGLKLPALPKRSERSTDQKPTEENTPKQSTPSRISSMEKHAEPEAGEHVIKKISVEAVSLPPEKPLPAIEPVKAPEIKVPKAVETVKQPEVLIQKAPQLPTSATEPNPRLLAEKASGIADLLSGMNALPKPKDDVAKQLEKLQAVSIEGEPKSTVKPEVKAADVLKAAADEHGAEPKPKTEERSTTADNLKPVLTLPPTPAAEPPAIEVQDSEFLKVLTELRSVVDEMKTKKGGRS